MHQTPDYMPSDGKELATKHSVSRFLYDNYSISDAEIEVILAERQEDLQRFSEHSAAFVAEYLAHEYELMPYELGYGEGEDDADGN